jgi:TonB-linked SusC/RagA family outer membrane protein
MKHFYVILFIFLPGLCASQTITGQVYDLQHHPLVGITVTAFPLRAQTATNGKGNFRIYTAAKIKTLKFSGTGWDPVEVNVVDKSSVSVILVRSNNKLDEVQVIAYGTNTQRYNVGSVTKVTSEEIGKQAISNPLEALQGRVAGLTITSTSGVPGSSFSVQIRGQNNLKPGNSYLSPKDNPLFIIDGVPFAPQNENINQFASVASPGDAAAYNNAFGGISPFNTINPSDIESIEVLRDADATAIYGSRGGNGVILITTKKGKAGKTELNINVRNGVNFMGKTMPVMNTAEYLSMRKQAFSNDGITSNSVLYDPGYAPDLLVFDSTKYTNWKKIFLGNTAHNTNAAASVSGGNESTQFRIAGSFNRDSYIFPGNFSDNRSSFSANIHHTSLSKKFTIDLSTNYSYEKNNSSGSPDLLSAYTLEPNLPDLKDGSGNLIWDYKGISLDGSYAGRNAFAYLQRKYNITNLNLNSNLLLAYQIVQGLTLRTSLGYNTFNSKEYSGFPKTSQNPAYNPSALASFGTSDFSTWLVEPQLEYVSNIKKNKFNILLGSTFQRNGSVKTETEYKYAAVFARVNYRYDNKYLFNLNGRRDGSSKFGPSKQFGNFGSVGAGWLFSEESLIKSKIPVLSYGKLRGSYGITGSDQIDAYQYISRYAATQNNYGGSIGYLPQNLYNQSLSWASTKKLEIGLELGFIQDKVVLSASWYRNRSGNQLITYQLPLQTGFSSVYENWDAVVQNTGWELSIQSSIIKNGNFSWSSSLNLTVPENKLLAFPGIQSSSYSTTYFVGKSLSTVTGFDYAGVNAENGLFQFKAANGDLTSMPQNSYLGQLRDFVFIGNTDPKFYGGFQNSITYKGLQLDFLIEFKKQLGVNFLSQIYSRVPGSEVNLPVTFNNTWRIPGEQAELQKLTTQYGDTYQAGSNFVTSSGVYSDASYIRFKTATISYSLPSNILQQYHVRGIRLYATAQNLFVITNYKGNDPETQNFYGVPPLKSISFGLTLNF